MTEEWARYHGKPGGLSAADPRFNGRVALKFEDGSQAVFQYAFAVEATAENSLIVFTEHCGYHRFPLAGLQWQHLTGNPANGGKNDG